MAKSDMSGWITLGVVAAGAYALYEYLKGQCAASPAPTGFVGTLCSSFGSLLGTPTLGTPLPAVTPAQAAAITAGQIAQAAKSLGPSPADPWAAAIAALKVAAGGNSENYDQWAWYWQNSAPIPGGPPGYGVPGSLSATVIANLITAGGAGDASNSWAGRGAKITAEQFVSDLKQAQGLSGLTPYAEIGIPAYLINGGY